MTTYDNKADLDATVTETSLQVIDKDTAGVMALAYMPEKEFKARLGAMQVGIARARLIQKKLMVKDEDYGVIPGTKKLTLLKPGAEKLCGIYRLVPTFEQREFLGDGMSQPELRVVTKCRLHLGDSEGPVVGEGVGGCNNWEKRYRYRTGERSCPVCEKQGTVLQSKKNRGEWFCWAKKGGCGMTFAADSEQAKAIASQEIGMVLNPDPFDQENTIEKMSAKRAYIDATLRATATSGLFTQDMEDKAVRDYGGDDRPEERQQMNEPPPKPARVSMREIDDIHMLIQERTIYRSWSKTLEGCRILPPRNWVEPANEDEARQSMLWLTPEQASHIKRILLSYPPREHDERQPGDEPAAYGEDIPK